MEEKATHGTAQKSGDTCHHLLLSDFVNGHSYVWEAVSACTFVLLLLMLSDEHPFMYS